MAAFAIGVLVGIVVGLVGKAGIEKLIELIKEA
jgi:hypothetical protein